jgi:hypothetical protein
MENNERAQPKPAQGDALMYFNALWFSIEKYIGVDPDCAHWVAVIRAALTEQKAVE